MHKYKFVILVCHLLLIEEGPLCLSWLVGYHSAMTLQFLTSVLAVSLSPVQSSLACGRSVANRGMVMSFPPGHCMVSFQQNASRHCRREIFLRML